MATKYIYLRGTCKWAKPYKPDEKYGNYTICLYPDEKSMNEISDSGLTINPKSDDDGIYYTFRRPHQKLMKNELVELGRPQVLAADNTAFDGLIGNGSEVTIKVSVYDTVKGKGHRWETVRVDNLVEYNPDNKDAGMPPPVVAAAAVKKAPAKKSERPTVPF